MAGLLTYIIIGIIFVVVIGLYIGVEGICIEKEIKHFEYQCFIEWVKHKADVDTWIDKLMDKEYSPEYVVENAEKYRDEFFQNMELSLEDVNMTYRQYVKYRKKCDRNTKIIVKTLRKSEEAK